MTQQVEAGAVPEIEAEEIDLDFSAVPRETVMSQEIDGELLLIDRRSGARHVLNPVGSVVWQCLYQGGTLAELVDDLADGFGVPAEVVAEDVLELARTVGRAGLLEGVARYQPPAFDQDTGQEVGEEVVPFTLPNLDGEPVDLASFRGRSVFIVNWSPGCGYCVMIAPKLAEAQPALAEQGVELVFLIGGALEANRELFETHGLDATVMLRDDSVEGFVDPFPAMGTPVAYLLDEEGKVAMPIAQGALEVPGLLRYAAGLPAEEPETAEDHHHDHDHDHAHAHGHDHDHAHDHDQAAEGDGDAEPAAPGPRYLQTGGGGGGMCNPGSGPKKLRVWAATSAYEVGEFHIGIRADSGATDALLGRVFADYRLPEGTEAPDNFSVVLGEAGKRGARGLNLLLRGNTTVVRSRSPRRVMRALASHLSTVLDQNDENGLLRTSNAGALIGDEAVLLPGVVVQWLEQVQPRLTRRGVRLSDEPFASLDPDTLELVVPEPGVKLDEAALAEVEEPKPSRSELARVDPGRYPLRAWALWSDTETKEQFSTARAVAAALASVHLNLETLDQRLPELKLLFEQVRPLALVFDNPDEFVGSLEQELTGASASA